METLIDSGDGGSWIFPFSIFGTIMPTTYGNDIAIREKKSKHIAWIIRNNDCLIDKDFRALVGKKVRVTIEIVEDAK